MDGCWEPWLVGCVIDWQAWGAIATVAAVAAALWIAGAERRDRMRAEKQQAGIIAAVVMQDLDLQLMRLSPAVLDFSNRDLSSTYFHMLLTHDSVARELTNIIANVQLLGIERSIERMHVLPPALSAKLLHALDATRTMQALMRMFPDVRSDKYSEDPDEFVEELAHAVLHTHEVLIKARDACVVEAVSDDDAHYT